MAAELASASELTGIFTSNPSEWKSHEGKTFDLVCSIVAVTHGLVISDRSGNSQVNILPGLPLPAAGDRVKISGIIEICKSGRIMPLCTSIAVLGHDRPPEAISVSGGEFASGKCDFKPVRAVGTVLDIMPDVVDDNYDILILLCNQERIPCPVKRGTVDRLLGHRVEAVGVCIPAPPMSRQMIGRILSTTRPFARLGDGPGDFFDVPELVNNRFRQPKDLSSLDRHKVRGTVLAVWKRGALVGTADNLAARVEFSDAALPACGDTIEVAGLPETDVYSLILRRARWRKLPEKRGCTEEKALNIPFSSIYCDSSISPRHKSTLLHGKLIRTIARVRSLPSSLGPIDYMLVGTDELSIPVDISSVNPRPQGLDVGSTVEISGIYILECQPWRANTPVPPIENVCIVVRSAKDIRVVATPSWWTATRLLVVIGILVAVLLLVIVWNISLQRLAERRGRTLSDERIAHAEAEIKTAERTRLAVELHDTIAQNLSGVSIAIDTARQFCQAARPELLQQINVADATLDACQTELRNCLWDLRNQALEEADLNTAIRTALQPHVADTKLDIRFNVSRDRLTENTTHAILRIIRELVINAIRHGHATSIQIAGALDPDALRFSVRDDGCGFDANNCSGIAQKHFGLQGIRERLSLLSGKMSIQSASGSGAEIVIVIPISTYGNQDKQS